MRGWNITSEDLGIGVDGNNNGTSGTIGDETKEDLTIWDIPSIRITFIVIHTIVFFLCFLGNLTVILVVTLHWKMRSITNFCLANLAVADLCVAIFCVFQNLYSHMATTWILGKSICKIYHFINEMSLTASVLILVVISIERYLAIIHPMRCKSWLTLNRLRLTIATVWGVSAIYSLPRLYYTTVISHGYVMEDGTEEIICTPNRQLYNSKLFDGIHMGLLFFFPLVIITILYTVIGIALWKSSRNQMPVSTGPSESSSENSGLVDGDGEGGDGLLHGKRGRGTSCREILCCSLPCFNCFNGPPRRPKRKELRNTNGNPGLEFTALRPHSTRNNREFGQTGISTTEPIVVVKFEDNKKTFFHRRHQRSGHRGTGQSKRCKIVMNLSSYNNAPDNNENKEMIRNVGENTSHRSGQTSFASPPDSGGSRNTFPFGSGNETTTNQLLPPEVTQPSSSSPQKLRRMRVIRGTNYGTKALVARRKIIKMLIIIVLTFAVCNLPFHGRKIWQNWSLGYDGTSTFSVILTQVTTIIRYANSAINPLLYAFMSAKFRQSLGDLLGCRLRRPFRNTRNFSVRSTNVIPLSTAA